MYLSISAVSAWKSTITGVQNVMGNQLGNCSNCQQLDSPIIPCYNHQWLQPLRGVRDRYWLELLEALICVLEAVSPGQLELGMMQVRLYLLPAALAGLLNALWSEEYTRVAIKRAYTRPFIQTHI